MAKNYKGMRRPVQACAMMAWDAGAGEFTELTISSGGMSADITKWGGTTVTGRDISLDLKALTDDSIKGLMRTIGDVGATPTNATGDTVLSWLSKLYTQVVAAVAQLVLVVSSVATIPSAIAIYVTATYAQGTLSGTTDYVQLDTTQYGGKGINIVGQSPAGADIVIQVSTDGTTWWTWTTVTLPPAGGSFALAWECAFRYVQVIVSSAPTSTVDVAIGATR